MRPLLALVLAVGFATAGFAASDIGIADFEVSGPDDTALVVGLSDAADAATATIGTCREAGGALAECTCANLEDIARVRAALEAALARHPEWTGKALFVADMGNGQSLTIWLDTVARMAEPPGCD